MLVKFMNPVPGSDRSNDGHYAADSGCDINVPSGTKVVACADGYIIYSERGHTPWVTPPDTPNSILLLLDIPIVQDGVTYYYAWYTHMSSLRYQVPDGGPRRHVTMGEDLGTSGVGNRVPHLHFGILTNRAQRTEKDWMAPARVADLVFAPNAAAPPNGTAAVAMVKAALPAVEIWWNDGEGAIKFNGVLYDIPGVKINDIPWPGGHIVVGPPTPRTDTAKG